MVIVLLLSQKFGLYTKTLPMLHIVYEYKGKKILRYDVGLLYMLL